MRQQYDGSNIHLVNVELKVQEILDLYEVIPFDVIDAVAWGSYTAKLDRPVPVMDSLIAAVAIARGLIVATHNAEDFPGVEIFDPIEA